MKKLLVTLMILIPMMGASAISPYYMVGQMTGDMVTIETKITAALNEAGFDVIGSYNTSGSADQKVLVYTSDELKKYCLMNKDRGMLAAALKVGIRKQNNTYEVTMLNPEYLFYAYLRGGMDNSNIKSGLDKVNQKATSAMKSVGGKMEPFGGDKSKADLKKYKYMIGMPNFEDPVELKEFSGFSEGVSTISRNLKAGKGNTEKVFEIIDEKNQVAVFGVGLLDPEEGEPHFLSIIGEKHIAAMPYEIILEGKTATMLHGRYRFASHWPELTMGTFTKIMSSPGDVEDFLEALTE